MLGRACQGLMHEVGPSRYRRATALLAFSQRAIRVEAHPNDRYQVAIEAIEPGVMRVVAGTGLAGYIVAVERAGALTGAALNDIRHHVRQQIGYLWANDLRCQILAGNHGLAIMISLVLGAAAGRRASAQAAGRGGIGGAAALRAGNGGSSLLDHLAGGIFDAGKVVRSYLATTVGKGRVA